MNCYGSPLFWMATSYIDKNGNKLSTSVEWFRAFVKLIFTALSCNSLLCVSQHSERASKKYCAVPIILAVRAFYSLIFLSLWENFDKFIMCFIFHFNPNEWNYLTSTELLSKNLNETPISPIFALASVIYLLNVGAETKAERRDGDGE